MQQRCAARSVAERGGQAVSCTIHAPQNEGVLEAWGRRGTRGDLNGLCGATPRLCTARRCERCDSNAWCCMLLSRGLVRQARWCPSVLRRGSWSPFASVDACTCTGREHTTTHRATHRAWTILAGQLRAALGRPARVHQRARPGRSRAAPAGQTGTASECHRPSSWRLHPGPLPLCRP
jgi:hypothetical protein